jgi:glycosyltransferase involved in cell wall biosynthesis
MKTPVCLVSIDYAPSLGGVAIAVGRLVRSLTASGVDVHVVVPVFHGGPAEPQRTVEDGVTVHRLSMDVTTGLQSSSFNFLQYVRALDREVNFALFHSFFLITAYACTLLAGKRPVIVSIRGGDLLTEHHPAIRSSAIFSLQKASWITSVNQVQLDVARKFVNLDGRSSVLRNGIAAVPESQRWSLTSCERGVVGTTGQFRRVKDIPLLVRAYAKVDRRHRRALRLAGRFAEAAEEKWSRTLMRELSIEDEVEITGERPHREVIASLPKLHVYVQNSAFEGMPNALLEAAACGVPLVATAVGGMGEILDDEADALLVPHGDPRALGRAIERVLSDDDLAQRLSRGALAVAGEWSLDREQREWLELYERFLP